MTGEPLLQAEDLCLYFETNGTVRAVDGVSLSLYPGEIYALVGESGSGKSTLARTLIRLYTPTSGTLRFAGRDFSGALDRDALAFLRSRVQMIFQDPAASLNPRRSIGESIAQGLDVQHLCRSRQERTQAVLQMMERVGLDPALAGRYPRQLSGGQCQRAAIARALIVKPRLLIADECVSALDATVRAQVIDLLRSLQQETGTTLLFISHDLSLVRAFSHRVGVMQGGHLVEQGSAEEIFSHPSHPCTRQLLSAIPVADPALARQRLLDAADTGL